MITNVLSKSLFASKTFWVNTISILLTVIEALTTANIPFISSKFFYLLVFILNIMLRYITNEPVTLKGNEIVQINTGL